MDRWTSKIQLREALVLTNGIIFVWWVFYLYQRCKEAKLMSGVMWARQKEAFPKSSASQSTSLQNSFPDSIWNQVMCPKSLYFCNWLALELKPRSFGGKEQHDMIPCNCLLPPTSQFGVLCFFLSKPRFCSASAFSSVDQCPENEKRMRETGKRKDTKNLTELRALMWAYGPGAFIQKSCSLCIFLELFWEFSVFHFWSL